MGDVGKPIMGLAETTRADWNPASPAILRRDL